MLGDAPNTPDQARIVVAGMARMVDVAVIREIVAVSETKRVPDLYE